MSIGLATSAESWFIAWLAIEINLLSFVPIILVKLRKYTSESALKYFLVQAIASGVLLASASFITKPAVFIIILALLLKTGVAPFHQWMPSVIEGLSWGVSFLLLSIQKMSPLILLSIISMNIEIKFIFIFFIVCRALVGSIGGLSQNSLRKILVFSSVVHLGWILVAIVLSNLLWMAYFFLYSLILSSIIILLNITQSHTLNNLAYQTRYYNTILAILTLMSLGGLPPFTGFLPKILVTLRLLEKSNPLLLIVLLASTFLSLFFYARIFIALMLINQVNKPFNTSQKLAHLFLVRVNLRGLLISRFFYVIYKL